MEKSIIPPTEQESPELHRRDPVIGADDSGGQDLDEHGMQHGGVHGPARDDALKRITRSHPLRDIPRMESMDPRRAPPKE